MFAILGSRVQRLMHLSNDLWMRKEDVLPRSLCPLQPTYFVCCMQLAWLLLCDFSVCVELIGSNTQADSSIGSVRCYQSATMGPIVHYFSPLCTEHAAIDFS